MKIAIVGNPGSGKSTLSLRLQKIIPVPTYHLDQYFWKPGWQRPDRDEFEKVHQELCDQSEWIIEGMAMRHFSYRVEKADIVIFLDMPVRVCLYRIFKRALLHFGKARDTSAPGCIERLPDREFLSYVWNFNQKQKHEIEVLFQHYRESKKIFVLRNNAEIEDFVIKLERVS